MKTTKFECQKLVERAVFACENANQNADKVTGNPTLFANVVTQCRKMKKCAQMTIPARDRPGKRVG